MTANIINSATSQCIVIGADSIELDLAGFVIDGNDVADYAFENALRGIFFGANSANTLIPYSNTWVNNTFNYSGFFYYKPDVLIDVTPNFMNFSGYGNEYYKDDGSGYSETCDDFNYDGFCDYPFNTTTETICSGTQEQAVGIDSTCGNLTDYFPISDEFDWFKIELYLPEQGRITHDNETFNFTLDNTGENHPLGFNCSLYINGAYVNSSIIQPDDGEANFNCGETEGDLTCSIIAPDLADGRYDWNVSCGTNMTLSRDVRIDAIAPFFIDQCNDSVDLENETFYLANNIFESMPYGVEAAIWNHTKVMCNTNIYDVCIPITAFNATFDGNGFNITGHALGTVGSDGYPVAVGIMPFVNNVTVQNLNTSNFSIGILSCDNNWTTIMHNDVSRSGPVDDGVIDSEGIGVFAIYNNFLQVLNNTANEIQQSGNQFVYYSSCPFIYIWNGTDWILQNEDLSPYHAYWNEGDYSARLPDLVAIGGILKLMIVENLNEITYFDSIALTKVTHNVGTEVYKDTNGNTYSVNNLKKPIKCVDSNTDCLKVISEEDGIFWNWQYDGDVKKADFVMEAVLTFEKEGNYAKLLWSPKLNADPLDPLYVDLLDLIGTANYDIFEKKTLDDEQWEGHKDAINTLYLWNGKDWELLHIGIESMSVNHAGKWIVPVDLSGIKGDTFRIKIVTFPMAGGPDFVWADFSGNDVISEKVVFPNDVSCNNIDGSNLFEEDNQYVVMNKGDKCEVIFEESKVIIGKIGEVSKNEVTYFTKSNGYYVPDFTKDIRPNKKNIITKFILETTFNTFWTHPDLRSVGNFFPEKYMSHLTTNVQKHPIVPLLEIEDKPYHTAVGYYIAGQSLDSNLVANNTCYSDRIAGMETCVQTGLTSNLTVQNNWAKNMRTCFPLVYSDENKVIDNTCLNFNASCVWSYSSCLNEIANNTCVNGTSPVGCGFNSNTLQFLGNACFMVTATVGDAKFNTFYNNFCNVSKFACVVSIDPSYVVAPNYWNNSNVLEENIIGRARTGGNFITNPDGDYYSDDCLNRDGDEFCDIPFDVENDAEGCTSQNCDYWPLAVNNSCDYWPTSKADVDCEDECNFHDRHIHGNLNINGDTGDFTFGRNLSIYGNITGENTCDVIMHSASDFYVIPQ